MKVRMIGISNITRRAIALRNARDKAQNPEVKKIWDQKLLELIRLAEQGRSSHDTIH